MQALKKQFLKSKKSYTNARVQIAEKINHTGLSVEQWAALTEIPDSGIGSGDLAKKAGLLGPSLSRMISELVRLGVISRSDSDADARACVLKLTAHGKKLLAKVAA